MEKSKTNKVRFGLKNAHWAKMTGIGEDGKPTYETPEKMPGAVSLSIDPDGENENFYADDGVYYVINNNSGYSGDFEVALITEKFRIEILQEEKDQNGVLLEKTTAEAVPFALMFEFEGDVKGIRHVLYNCTVSRPGTEGSTTEESKTPQTETLPLTAAPLDNGYVKAKTGDETTDEVYNGWFENVYFPQASEAV